MYINQKKEDLFADLSIILDHERCLNANESSGVFWKFAKTLKTYMYFYFYLDLHITITLNLLIYLICIPQQMPTLTLKMFTKNKMLELNKFLKISLLMHFLPQHMKILRLIHSYKIF